MAVVLFETETPTRARVTTLYHQPDKVDPAAVAKGLDVGELPPRNPTRATHRQVAYVNPQTAELWYEDVALPIDPIDFKRLLTRDERKAIRRAAKQDESIEDFLDILDTAKSVQLDDPDLMAGVQYMVQQGLLTQARGEAVLAGQA